MTRFLPCALAAALVLAASAFAADTQPVGGCPGADRQAVVSSRIGATQELVPPGAQAVLLCRYSGIYNGFGLRLPAFRLQAHRLLAGEATVAGMTRQLDSLPRITTPIACPASFGTAIVAYFRYATGPEDPVTVALGGCLDASNGHVSRVALSVSGYALVKRLAALTGLHLAA